MTKILGLSGRKQAGKSSASSCLVAASLGGVGFDCKVDEQGKLLVYSDDIQGYGMLDLDSRRADVKGFLEQEVWGMIKLYSFADSLKEFCVNMFNLSERQAWGTDAQKNSLTNVRWENIPGVICDKKLYEQLKEVNTDVDNYLYYHIRGKMTGREVLQFFGTNVCRKIYGDCWVNATLKRIMVEQPAFAVIIDLRFPNEVDGVKVAGGKVIRLTRAPFTDDEHESEKALDHYTGFDFVLDNSNMDICTQAKEIEELLLEWGWITK